MGNSVDRASCDEHDRQTEFEALVVGYRNRIYSFCHRRLADAGAAEDATQETFLAAWRHSPDLPEITQAWLLHVAANKCRDELRRRSRRSTRDLRLLMDREADLAAAPPDARTLAGQLSHDLKEAIEGLPREQKVCLVLADLRDLAYAEIASVTGADLGTVKSRLHRARRSVRKALVRRRGARSPNAPAPEAS